MMMLVISVAFCSFYPSNPFFFLVSFLLFLLLLILSLLFARFFTSSISSFLSASLYFFLSFRATLVMKTILIKFKSKISNFRTNFLLQKMSKLPERFFFKTSFILPCLVSCMYDVTQSVCPSSRPYMPVSHMHRPWLALPRAPNVAPFMLASTLSFCKGNDRVGYLEDY